MENGKPYSNTRNSDYFSCDCKPANLQMADLEDDPPIEPPVVATPVP